MPQGYPILKENGERKYPPVKRDKHGYILPGQQVPGYIARDRKYNTYEELHATIVKFIDFCTTKEKPMTIERLVTFLGITRQTLLNYEAYHREQIEKHRQNKDNETENQYGRDNSDSSLMLDLIKQVRAEILADRVDLLIDMKNRNAAGSIFLLKNSHGFVDRTEHKSDVNHNFNINISDDEQERLQGKTVQDMAQGAIEAEYTVD